jgi:hypothetical protein
LVKVNVEMLEALGVLELAKENVNVVILQTHVKMS